MNFIASTLRNRPELHQRVLLFLIFLPLGAYLPEIFKYDGFIARHTGIAPVPMLIGFWFVLMAFKLAFHISLSDKTAKLFVVVIAPLLLAAAVGMQLLEKNLFENVVFAYSGIQPRPFAIFSLLSIAYALLLPGASFYRKVWQQLLFVYGFVSFWFLLFIYWWNNELFLYLDKEDSPLEYATFALFALAAGVSILAWRSIAKKMKPSRLQKFWQLLLIVSALGLSFVAFEEISWGQRIIGINTPDALATRNLQNETNIHNLDVVFGHVYDAYLTLGVYGIFSGIFRFGGDGKAIEKISTWFKPVLSRWYLAPYFLYIVVYVLWRYTDTIAKAYDIWEEATELFLAFGICTLFYLTYREIKSGAFFATAE